MGGIPFFWRGLQNTHCFESILNHAVNGSLHFDLSALRRADIWQVVPNLRREDEQNRSRVGTHAFALSAELAATPDILQFFENHFGPYPFADEKYGHAQYTAGGALEVQTMSFMGFFNFDVIAHEMAHQWFGDNVTFGSWTDIWMSEGKP